MAEYIEREAISEEIRKYYYKNPPNSSYGGKGLTVVLIERKEQYSTLLPPTLRRLCMGGGKKKATFSERANLSAPSATKLSGGRALADSGGAHFAEQGWMR